MIRTPLLSLLLACHTALAEPSWRIPVSPEPPWVIQEGDSLRGIDIDIIKLLSQELGFSVELMPCPWARCLKMMEQGDADFMLAVFKRPERAAYLEFVEPGYLLDDPKAFYVPIDSPLRIQSYSDLTGLNIGIIRGAAYFERFDNYRNLQKYEVANELLLLRMLKRKRLDAVIGSPTVMTYQINSNGMKGQFRRESFHYEEEAFSYMAFSKKSALLDQLPRVSAVVTRLKAEGRFRQVVDAFLERQADRQ